MPAYWSGSGGMSGRVSALGGMPSIPGGGPQRNRQAELWGNPLQQAQAADEYNRNMEMYNRQRQMEALNAMRQRGMFGSRGAGTVGSGGGVGGRGGGSGYQDYMAQLMSIMYGGGVGGGGGYGGGNY